MAKKKAASEANGQALVIVESPAKAKTIAKYLGQRLPRRGQHWAYPRPSPGGQANSR